MDTQDTSSDTEDYPMPDASLTAAQHKEQGNTFYKSGLFAKAVEEYNHAIEKDPSNAAYLGNRAAAYMQLKKWQLALDDCLKALEMQPVFPKANLRASKCYMQFGEMKKAREMLTDVSKDKAAIRDLAYLDDVDALLLSTNELLKNQEYKQALPGAKKLLQDCGEFLDVRVLLGDVMVGNKLFDQARALADSLYNRNPGNSEVLRLRGTCFYYTQNVNLAMRHFKQVLQRDPDDRKMMKIYKLVKKSEALKTKGNKAFGSGFLQKAIDFYTEALNLDPLNDHYNGTIYSNRAACYMKVKQWAQAKRDCDNCIQRRRDFVKGYLRRGQCYLELEKYQQAIKDFEHAQKLDPENQDVARNIQKAKLELKKSLRKDYYKILGISKNATEREIKKAYRKQALINHPDKCRGDEEEKKKAEKKFKDIGEAYEVLSDPQKKRDWDGGKDLREMGGGGHGHGHGGFDQSDIFNMFMRQGGGGFGGHGSPFG